MLRKRAKIKNRVTKIILATLLLSSSLPGMVKPVVAEAASTTITVSSIVEDGGNIRITSNPANSMQYDGYGSIIPSINNVGDVNITGSSVRVGFRGYYPGATANGHTVTVSGTNTLLGSVTAGIESYGAAVSNNTAIIKDASINYGDYAAIVVGGDSLYGAATTNTVEISGATIGTSDSYPSMVIGGASFEGDVKENKVKIEGDSAKVYGDVIGGISGRDREYGIYYAYVATTVELNEVNINGGEVQKAIGGAAFTSSVDDDDNPISGTVNNNTVNITNGKVTGGDFFARDSMPMVTVAGGYALNGDATNNRVNISGGEVAGSLFAVLMNSPYAPGMIVGGMAEGGEAKGNRVTISGGILGGGNGLLPISTVAPDDPEETSEAPALVVGGFGTTKANNNTVTISGGDIKDGVNIIGGMVGYERQIRRISESTETETETEANDNTVNILTALNANYLIGGLNLPRGDSGKDSGNTLNVGAKNVTAYAVAGFQNMNFYLPPEIAKGDTMLTIKGLESTVIDENGDPVEGETEIVGNDLRGVAFGVAAQKGVNLQKGDKVTLVKGENGLITDDELKPANSKKMAEFIQQNNMTTEEKYELSIKKEGDDAIVTTVDDIIENETDPDARKSPVETRAAVVTMINAAGDLLAGQGMANAEVAAQEVKGGSNIFAAVSGNHLRAESGSHVTTKGLGLNLGFAKEIENKSGKLLIGPVLEYGHGNYDSYQDNGMKADGKASYWGIGVIAKQTNNSGFYYEGSLRVGRAKSDYGSDSIVENSHISYDSSATYWAAHLGAGMLKDIGHDNTLDYYGKYFYSHTGGDSATIYRDGEDFDQVTFDGVNSNRIRLGARISHAINERNKIYGGLAYQYEFSGSARATYREGAAPSPGIKGSSGLIELGWQVRPGKKCPMAIDIGVTGWVGKQRGITANVQANWTF